MTIDNLDRVFQPGSVAVIGASEKSGSIGAALMSSLVEGGFRGSIYPVNPKYNNVLEHAAFPSVEQVPAPFDLALIATPIRSVPDIVEKCARAGAAGVVVISAGGREIGQAGAVAEKKIEEAASANNIRVIGPNCLGFACPRFSLNASFAGRMPPAGRMAFISQSGAICTSVLDFSLNENIGFSYFVSLGSMVDVDFGDVIDYVGNDPAVSSIVLFIEHIVHARNFMSAARAVSRVKPIIALKAGRSRAGQKAAASHTGALASEDAVYDSAFKRAGIVRVRTFQELFDCADFLAKQPLPGNSGLAIVTNSGATGVMAVDALSDYQAEPAELEEEVFRKLDELLPPYWSHSNPVDILGDATVKRYRKTVEILLQSKGIDGLLIMLSPQALTEPAEVAEALVECLKGKRIPVITAWMGGLKLMQAGKYSTRLESVHLTPLRGLCGYLWIFIAMQRTLRCCSRSPPECRSA